MNDALRSITALVEDVLLYASIAFFVVVGVVGVIYGGLRVAVWLTR